MRLDRPGRNGERFVEAADARPELGEGGEEVEIGAMLLGIRLAGHRLRDGFVLGGRREQLEGRAVEVPPRRKPTGRLVDAALGGGEEALQVADPIAPIAPRIDPVVAEPAGIAPRPDRVRVDARGDGLPS